MTLAWDGIGMGRHMLAAMGSQLAAVPGSRACKELRRCLRVCPDPACLALASPAQGEAKERFNEIQQELSQLSTKFSNNVLDATKVGGHISV